MLIRDGITGRSRLAAVIGNPIEHSISPQLHNTLGRLTGTDLVYVAMRIEKDSLGDAVKGFRAMGFIGFNVTIPYKTEVIKYMDELSEEALVTGAVNTVKIEDGLLKGFNTDGEGFLRSFREETGREFAGKAVVILGAGGAARSIAYRVALEGVRDLFILNRTAASAEGLGRLIGEKTGVKAHIAGINGEDAAKVLHCCDVIINTTPLGMHPRTGVVPVDKSVAFRDNQVVHDIIYNPARTLLLKKAEEAGCIAVNGLGMLIYQGITSYEIWTGIDVPRETGRKLVAEFKKYMGK